MRTVLMVFALGLIPGSVVAQQAAPSATAPVTAAQKTFASAADVAALVAKARAQRKPDQANLVQPLLQLAPYTVNLESRVAVANAAVHEREAELFYVVGGAGTLVTGGTLTAQTRTNADNLSGTGIEGGSAQHVATGDFILVPENTPHWFSGVEGSLVLMSFHVPRTTGAQAR
jgi:mannose-6-phosphate isomerase-like protein (cupin superfamily)